MQSLRSMHLAKLWVCSAASQCSPPHPESSIMLSSHSRSFETPSWNKSPDLSTPAFSCVPNRLSHSRRDNPRRSRKGCNREEKGAKHPRHLHHICSGVERKGLFRLQKHLKWKGTKRRILQWRPGYLCTAFNNWEKLFKLASLLVPSKLRVPKLPSLDFVYRTILLTLTLFLLLEKPSVYCSQICNWEGGTQGRSWVPVAQS